MIPQKKPAKETKDSSKNDSINASHIIASLVEANKGKLLNQRFNRKTPVAGFEKAEDFRAFPNKLNSSIYEGDSAKKGSLTNRSSIGGDDSIDSKRSSLTGEGRRFKGLNYST